MATKSKSDQSTSFDPELKGAALDTYRTGQRVAALPYAPYDAATVAPMSPFQQAAKLPQGCMWYPLHVQIGMNASTLPNVECQTDSADNTNEFDVWSRCFG